MCELDELFAPYVRALHVCAQSICPITGCRLDVQTALMVEQNDGRILLALSPEGWRQRRQDILAHMPDDVTVTPALGDPRSIQVAVKLNEEASE